MDLSGKTIAIFVADLFDEREFWYPYYRMLEEKANVMVVGPTRGVFIGKKGISLEAPYGISQLKIDNVDAVIIPGGFAPDYIRQEPEMVDFVRRMNEQGKTIGAICHAPWVLASAGILKKKMCTSYFSIKDDLVNAGAYWIDQDVVIEDNIITSRNPDDLPVFCRAIIESFYPDTTVPDSIIV